MRLSLFRTEQQCQLEGSGGQWDCILATIPAWLIFSAVYCVQHAPRCASPAPDWPAQLNTWGLTGNADTFRQGATAFQNGRDLANEWRNGFIAAANERVDSLNVEPSTLDTFLA